MSSKDRVNISSHLKKRAAERPDDMAIAWTTGYELSGQPKYEKCTLEKLDKLSDAAAFGLKDCGVSRGCNTLLMVPPGLEFFVLTFALFKLAAIPVLIDPGIGMKNLKRCIAEAEPKAFIGTPRAHMGRILYGWGKKTIEKTFTVGRRFLWGGPRYMDLVKVREPKEPFPIVDTFAIDTAAILFTSGNTGISKGVIYTHGIFDAQVESIRTIYDIQPGEIDLATFPLFALFGPTMGMAAVIPDMDASQPAEADPEKIIRAARDFDVTNMFASPALIDKLGRYGDENNITLPNLKRVISAGAHARPESLERFSKMLPEGAEIFTPYGATEALPICNIGSREILSETAEVTRQGGGMCVGRPVPGIQLKIIKITDKPVRTWRDELELPAGEIGEITVKGPVVTRQYYNRQEETVLSKIVDTSDGSLFHRMGDVGYIDEKGRVWYCGRKSHRVETKDGTLFTVPCEGIFNVHPDVNRTALVGVEKNGKTIPVLCVEMEGETRKSQQDIKKELIEIGSENPKTSMIKEVLFHPGFPVDIRHNAKILRGRLAQWAQEKLK